jgi:signal transduction histidine kinase
MTTQEKTVPRWREFPGSIRLRLTVWYTLLLALVLLSSFQLLHVLLERRVRADVDQRVLAVAQDVADRVRADPSYPDLAHIAVPALDPFASPGLYAQILDGDGTVLSSSDDIDSTPLPAADMPEGSSSPVYRTSSVNGVDLRTVRLPLLATAGTSTRLAGSVVVGESFLPVARTLDRLQQLLFALGVSGIILAGAGGWFLAGRALRPVDDVTAAAAAIAARAEPAMALTTRLTVPGTNDEVARLAATFNAMLDRLESAFAAQRRLVEAQRRFVADASHELRTPLTAVRSSAEILLQQVRDGGAALAPADLSEGLDGICRGALRMSRLVDDLLRLAHAEAGAPRPFAPVRLDEVAREAVLTAESVASARTVQLESEESIPILGDGDRLHELVVILVENALRYSAPGDRVTVRVERMGPDRARLTVQDTGQGISPEHLPHLFERFYRADPARGRASGGSGLGLAIARTIVESHRGEIAVESALGVGTTVTATFPALPTGAVAAPALSVDADSR